MKAQSAKVLDEASAFEKRLAWTLFTMKQEKMLWEHNPKTHWVPGRPLYSHPWYLERVNTDPEVWSNPDHPQWWSGHWGNEVRPMMEEFYEEDDYGYIRCETCEVSWPGRDNNTCWMCGEERPLPEPLRPVNFDPRTRYYVNGEPVGLITDFEGYLESDVVEYAEWDAALVQSIMERMTAATEAMRVSFSTMQDAFIRFGDAGILSTPRQAGRTNRIHQAIMEVNSRYGSPTGRHIHMYLDEVSHWWRPQPFIVHGVEIPQNWRELRADIPLPEMPEPRDFTDWVPSGSGPAERRRR